MQTFLVKKISRMFLGKTGFYTQQMLHNTLGGKKGAFSEQQNH